MTPNKIVENIIDGNDEFFDLTHFSASNMADYATMAYTISDMVAVYDINEHEAGEIIHELLN